MKIIIPGRPVPAVRMTQRSKFVNKQAIRYLEYKSLVGQIARLSKPNKLIGPVEVKATAYIFGRQPDADNLAKAYLDGLNGIAYEDDRQVMKLTIEKVKVKKGEEHSEVEVVPYDQGNEGTETRLLPLAKKGDKRRIRYPKH